MTTTATPAASPARFTLTDTLGRRVLLSTILASSMAFIDGSALNVALAALQDDLGASGVELLWIVNAYMLMLASLILIGGSLGDHLGRNRIFRIGIAVFALGSAACGLAPVTEVLIAARAVQGIGGALMVPGSLAIISALFADSARGKAIGLWSAASTVTTIGGPILGGLFADAGFWRGVFFINLPLAAVSLWALQPVPESRDDSAPEQLDYSGAALTVLGLAGLTYGLVMFGDRGVVTAARDPLVWLALVIGGAALAAFVVVERRSDHPMIDLRLFRSRSFTGANLTTAFLYGALAGGLFFLPLNMIQVQGYDASLAGLTFLPFSILLALLSPLMGGFVDRYGPRGPLIVGPLLVAASYVALALPGVTDGPGAYWTTYFPGAVLLGLGMGLTVAPLTTTVMGSIVQSHAGVASGINNAVSRSAQVLAVALFGAVGLGVFSVALDAETEALALTDTQRDELQAEARDLADAEPPAGLDDTSRQRVEAGIDAAFVSVFRVVSLLAAGMCLIGAGLAAVYIRKDLTPYDPHTDVPATDSTDPAPASGPRATAQPAPSGED